MYRAIDLKRYIVILIPRRAFLFLLWRRDKMVSRRAGNLSVSSIMVTEVTVMVVKTSKFWGFRVKCLNVFGEKAFFFVFSGGPGAEETGRD